MIYFDNSATTRFKPQCVVAAAVDAINNYSANPGRSGHAFSLACMQKIIGVRRALCEFTGGDACVFTANCTDALNLAIMGTVKKGGHVVVSAFEHNAVLRCVHRLSSLGVISYSVAQPVGGVICARSYFNELRANTYACFCSHVCNVHGAVADVDGIGRLCRSRGVLFCVDGAQSAGYLPVNMAQSNVDLLAIAPHKGLHAIAGVGTLIARGNVRISPVRYGGSASASSSLDQPSDVPDGLEAGTLAVPNILALGAAVEYTKNSAQNERKKVAAMHKYLVENLRKIDAVTLYSPPVALDGIISFNIGNLASMEVTHSLSNDYDICVRGGLHCAPLCHQYLGTFNQGCVRVSLGCDNNFRECDKLINAVKEIVLVNNF